MIRYNTRSRTSSNIIFCKLYAALRSRVLYTRTWYGLFELMTDTYLGGGCSGHRKDTYGVLTTYRYAHHARVHKFWVNASQVPTIP